ncbi:ricin-type beta-trefoil lectin domain protein [Streptomyces sp. SP17BM10]|uniref:RHS repeat-associated core domain-containing protein n=1 Tax=Streptomyces sp. SP17BM10 TaxID=3002530 RepID=UPI002E795815|nr:RHS repeat-associated core domain-containing protein [Streptomyces sp. SP17BM10]MEE1782859.1 ricin-type beta-trefoil lectin domain protein [Streptomyces sp. SP17BM10]
MAVTVAAVLGSMLAPVSVATAAGPDYSKIWSPPNTALPKTPSVKGANVAPVPVAKPEHPVPPVWTPPKSPQLVPAGHASVRLGSAPGPKALTTGERPEAGDESKASGLPVTVAPLAGSSMAGQTVQVDVADAKATAAAGLPGVAVTITRPGAGDDAPVRLDIDASSLDAAFGANWAARAHLVVMPECATTTPQVPGCLKQTPLDSHYDPSTKKLVADVPLTGTGTAKSATVKASTTTADGAARAVYADSTTTSTTVVAVSGSSSGAGTYSATSLNPSQAWTAGGSSGAFTYSYPVQSPPALGGSAPSVALGYDSSSVDGKTSSTNSQASWIGDGWDYQPGFVERSYKPCSQDGITGSGDECWGGANLTLSMAGHSGQLVPDDASCTASAPASMEQSACTWRLKGDDGTKIQFLTGATNGTWNGSYIKLTDTHGTAYYFGLSHLPDANGNPSTLGADSGSAWTVPVFSPNSGDPCYDSTKGQASWCRTAWRWNLDFVVDTHGNLTTYTYTPETNYYALGGGQNNGTGASTSYTRSGVPSTIGYGQRLSDQLGNNGSYNPAAKIVFTSGERCIGTACDPAQRTLANATNWPDVPLDQQCDGTSTCTVYGPTYWTTKWLNNVTTYVRANGAYQTVDSYALNHTFANVQNATENTQVAWLASVQRTGQDAQATGGAVPPLPPVSFTSQLLPNRVDGTNLVPARPAYNRPRIQMITSETGSTIGVNYDSDVLVANSTSCSRNNNVMPATADSDTRSCYNVKWYPPNSKPGDAPVDDWFLRYPVTSVTVNPNTPGATPQVTGYSYGKAAWHRNDSPLTRDVDRTWDQFRGYASVTAVTGSGTDGPQAQKSTTYYQGMDGDRLANGSARSITNLAGPMSGQVTGSNPVTDSDWLSGQTLESDTYTQAGGGIASYTVNTFSGPVTTATHGQGSLPSLVARYAATGSVGTSKDLKADNTWRTSTRTTTSDSAHNNRLSTDLHSADGLPDICNKYTYATGANPQQTDLLSRTIVETGTNPCTAQALQPNTVSATRTLYDGLPFGQAGAVGDPTGTQVLDSWDANGNPVYPTVQTKTYDAYGRVSSVTDPFSTDSAHTSGAITTTRYSAAQTGELPTGMTVTIPAPAGASDVSTGRTTTTTLDSARALPTAATDPNGRTVNEAYDQLGRLTSVWLPGRPTTSSANKTFSYSLPGIANNSAVPPTITTSILRSDGSHSVGIQITDGLGRTVQTQSSPASSAYSGRMITDAVYDSQGRIARANAAWYNNDTAPSTTLYQTTIQRAPAQTYTVYDGLGRPVTIQSLAFGAVQSTTTNAYPGVDRTDVTPPAGATPTSLLTDARGQKVQLWQYRTATATGNQTDADVTSYTYTTDGHLATQKDAAGNTWTHAYDLRGREISTTDPDTGTTTKAFDPAGRLASTTDARNQTVTYAYDLLGRKTGSFAGAATTANQLTGFTYDTVLPGQPATSTRYVGGGTGTAYTTSIDSYDTDYHPTQTTTTIPGSEISSAQPFKYVYQASYDPITGALTADSRPAVGDIAAETDLYSYDTNGPLSSFGAFGGVTYDVGSAWDAYGRNIRSTVNPWGTQIVVTNTYDESTGRPLQQFVDKQTAGTGAVQQTTYAYNAAGQVTAARNIPDNTPSSTDLQCFGYDYLGRLNAAWSDTGTLTQAAQPTVGGVGSCTNSTPTGGAQAPSRTTVGGPAAYWQTYGYDLTGNRTQLVQHDPSGDTTKDATSTQTFPAAGTVNSGSGGPHSLTTSTTAVNGNSTGYAHDAYDAAGNTASLYTYANGTTTLGWTAEGKLDTVNPTVQITGVGGKCLYLQNSSSASGTPAAIAGCTSTPAEKFNTTGNVLKVYGQCLTAMGTTAGSAVQLQPCSGSSTQTWTSRSDGTMLNGAANECLAVPGGVTADGTAVVIADCGTPVPAGQGWSVPDQHTGYVYDASGNQLIRRDPGKVTITLGGDELVYSGGTPTGVRYYQIPGGITLVRQGGTSTFQINDPHGTGTLALDGTTLTESRRPTDPFGNPRGPQPATWAGDHGFVGGTKDDTTGLTNLGAREYQPSTGRFINPDLLLNTDDPQQWNGYGYGNNDPVNRSDPSGLMVADPTTGLGFGTVSQMDDYHNDHPAPDPICTPGTPGCFGPVVPTSTSTSTPTPVCRPGTSGCYGPVLPKKTLFPAPSQPLHDSLECGSERTYSEMACTAIAMAAIPLGLAQGTVQAVGSASTTFSQQMRAGKTSQIRSRGAQGMNYLRRNSDVQKFGSLGRSDGWTLFGRTLSGVGAAQAAMSGYDGARDNGATVARSAAIGITEAGVDFVIADVVGTTLVRAGIAGGGLVGGGVPGAVVGGVAGAVAAAYVTTYVTNYTNDLISNAYGMIPPSKWF